MKKPEVEPLSDLSWQRVERGLFRGLEGVSSSREEKPPVEKQRLPRNVALVLAGAAAALLGIVGWRWLAAPPPGNAPSRIVTAGSPTRVAIGQSSLEVAPHSALVVSGDDDRGLLVLLEQGTVTCEVAPRRDRPPFRVQAGEVQVRVVGTRFSVARAGEAAEVAVEHGVVEVTARGQTVLVGAQERWPAAPPPPNIVPVEPVHHPVKRHVTVAPPPSVAAPPAPPPLAVVAPPPPPAPSSQERYEGAARLEATDPGGAIAIYRTLESGGDGWAANALYAHGRLEADRGHRDEARRLLGAYVERFPHGANREDARHLLDRLR